MLQKSPTPAQPRKAPAASQQPNKSSPNSTPPQDFPAEVGPPRVTQAEIEELGHKLRIEGRELLDAGRCQEAVQTLLKAYEIQREYTDALAGLGYCYEQLGNYAEALQYRQEQLKYGLDQNGRPLSDEAKRLIINIITRLQATIDEKIRQKYEARRPPKRPRWQLALGGSLASAGGVLMGFGIPALALQDHCIGTPAPGAACATKYDTQSLGVGLVSAGGILILAGVVTIAWPPASKPRPSK